MTVREIKFRIWDLADEEMLSENDLDNRIVETGEDGYFHFLKVARYIPLQYTGLKDKNGAEIYEGDILKGLSKETPNGRWTVLDRVYYTNRGTWDCDSFLLGDTNETCEVIGNIYENPELLEVNK